MESFIINTKELPQQIVKVQQILSGFKRELEAGNRGIRNYDLNNEISSLSNFLNNLYSIVESSIKVDGKFSNDIFGNKYQNPYDFIQITEASPNTFASVRFLGQGDNGRKRYYVSDLRHNFSNSTIEMIKEIKRLSETPLDAVIPGQEFINWDKFSNTFFNPPPFEFFEAGISAEALIQKDIDLAVPFMTREEIQERNAKIFQFKVDIFNKAKDDVDNETNIIDGMLEILGGLRGNPDFLNTINEVSKFVDRFSFCSILDQALACVLPSNVTCLDILKLIPLPELENRIAYLFPRETELFLNATRAIENALFGQNGNLREKQELVNSLIKEEDDLRICYIEKEELGASQQELDVIAVAISQVLAQKERAIADYEATKVAVIGELGLSSRQAALFSDDKLNLLNILSDAQTPQEQIVLDTAKEKILRELERLLPIQALCQISFKDCDFTLSAKLFASLKFPDLRPVNDIFLGFSDQILKIFLQIISELIIMLMETILNQTLNCDDLSGLIDSALKGDLDDALAGRAAAIGDEFGRKLGEYGPRKLDQFGIKPELLNLFGQNTRQAVEGIAEASADVVVGDINSQPDLSVLQQGIFDYSIVAQYPEYFSNWEIDASGKNFIVVDGKRPVNVAQMDEALGKTIEEALRYLPICSMSAFDVLSRVTSELDRQRQELPSLQGLDTDNAREFSGQATGLGQAADRNKVKQELSSLLFNFTALGRPSEIVGLLAGQATDETADLVGELMNITSPTLKDKFNNKDKIKSLFKQIGVASGLDGLLPQLQLLASLPESEKRIVPANLCEPFDSVDNFRKALMTKVVPENVAENIINNINNEKIKKYNELVNTVLALTGGELPNEIVADPRRQLIEDIKKNILDPANQNLDTNPSNQNFDTNLSSAENAPEDSDAAITAEGSLPPSISDLDLPDEDEDSVGGDDDEDDEEADDKPRTVDNLMRQHMKNITNSSPIYKGMLESSLLSVFLPIRDAFDNAMQGYIESMSEIKETVTGIPRVMKLKTEVLDNENKLKEGEFISQSIDKEGNITKKVEGEIINPEFKDMLNQGLVPILKKDTDQYAEMVDKKILKLAKGIDIEIPFIGTFVFFAGGIDDARINGTADSDFTKGNWQFGRLLKDFSTLGFEPESRDPKKKKIKKIVKERVIGDSILQGIKDGFNREKLIVNLELDKFEISLPQFESKNSALPALSESLKFLGSKNPLKNVNLKGVSPKWTITFTEENSNTSEKTTFNVSTNGSLMTAKNSVEDFSKPFKVTFPKILITQKLRDEVSQNYNSPLNPIKSRVRVFRNFFSNNLYDNIQQNQRANFKTTFEAELINRQKEFIGSFAEQFGKKLADTRMFKKTKIGNPNSKEKVIFLQLFDFIRKPTPSEEARGFDPHIMDFDSLYAKFKDIYDKEPEVKQSVETSKGLVKKRTKFTNAAYKITIDVFVRIAVVDFCLKTLPVLDSFMFTKQFGDIEAFSKFMAEKIKEDLERLKIYEIFERETKKAARDRVKAKAKQEAKKSAKESAKAKAKQKAQAAAEKSAAKVAAGESTGGNGAVDAPGKEPSVKSKMRAAARKAAKEFDKKPFSFKKELETKVKENFENILKKLQDIFYINEKEREVDQFKKFFINSIPLLDVHAPDRRPILNRLSTKEETETVSNLPKEVEEKFRAIGKELEDLEIAIASGSISEDKLDYGEYVQKMQEVRTEYADQIPTKTSELRREVKVEISKFDEIVKENDFILQKYIKFGKLNAAFKTDPVLIKLENKVLNLEYAKELLSQKGSGSKLYDCDKADPNSFFLEPPQFGLRLANVFNKKDSYLQNNFFIKSQKFTISNNSENYLYTEEEFTVGTKRDGVFVTTDDEQSGKKQRSYNLLKLDASEVAVDSNLTVSQLIKLLSKETYDKVFYPSLKYKLLGQEKLRILFDYCLPVKEIAMMALIHTYYLNCNEVSKYLFESVKEAIASNLEILDNYGDKTRSAQKILAAKQKFRDEVDNEGNPAGPLNFDLLKIFLRTPIHILRGLATIVDTNIFWADKIVAGVSIAGSLIGQKIFLPYSLASIALLPFPIFTGPPPVGIAPPFTTYTLPLPIGPIFLILEPLLWDLPWFQKMNSDPNNARSSESMKNLGVDLSNITDRALLSDPLMEDEQDEDDEPPFDPLNEENKFVMDAIIDEVKKRCGIL